MARLPHRHATEDATFNTFSVNAHFPQELAIPAENMQ